jgi:hypothetical protein
MQSTQPLRMFLALTLFSGFAAACAQTARPLPLARTPPMGWNSWNHFAQRVTDADVRAAADAMVANGMRGAGYIYVNIDDSWEGTFRRSISTWLIDNDENVKVTQELLRHSHSKTTLDIYAKAVTPSKRRAHERIVDGLLAAADRNVGIAGQAEITTVG